MKKKIVAFALLFCMLFTASAKASASTASGNAEKSTGNVYGQSYIIFGEDLSDDQKKTVLNLLGVVEEELPQYKILTVSNKEEHKYLDAFVDKDKIGTKAFSSVKFIPKAPGTGLKITTHNIDYCTVSMYQNALITAGVQDAEVVIAAPFELSGTAALIGIVKAYCDMTGEVLDEQVLMVATNELVLTGKLGTYLGDTDKVAEFIAYAKQLVVSEDLESEEEIRSAVKEAAKEFDMELTEAQVTQVVDLLRKIAVMDIDPHALAQQASDMYNALKAMGIDLDKMDAKSIIDLIKNFFQEILDFLTSLFS